MTTSNTDWVCETHATLKSNIYARNQYFFNFVFFNKKSKFLNDSASITTKNKFKKSLVVSRKYNISLTKLIFTRDFYRFRIFESV